MSLDKYVIDLLGDEFTNRIHIYEKNNIYDQSAIYKLYLHVVPKEISGHTNDKYYVGKTMRSFQRRFGGNGIGYKLCPHFYRAITKYGWDNIDHYYLTEHLTEDQATELEKDLIKHLHSNTPECGYNCTVGGDGGNTKSLRPVKQYDIEGNYIKTFDSASEAARSIGVNRNSIFQACDNKGTSGGYQWRYLEDAVDGSYRRSTQKTVYKYSLDKQLLDCYLTLKHASNETGYCKGSLSKACKYNNKYHGYIWSYQDLSKVS